MSSIMPTPLTGAKRLAVTKDGKVIRIYQSANPEADERDAECMKRELKAAYPQSDIAVKALQGISG